MGTKYYILLLKKRGSWLFIFLNMDFLNLTLPISSSSEVCILKENLKAQL
jgi:hypothetical protein